jgi:uncharacterized alkaline shock family protein YloU
MAARWERLPCDTDPERLVGYAADGLRPPAGSHEAGCAFCQAAMGEFAALWRPVREWSTREVSVPDRFVAAVLVRVRRIAQSPRHAISASARGATVVTSWVLGLIAATATRDTPGVVAVTGAPTDLHRRAAVRYGADGVDIEEIDEAAISVRTSISAGPVASLPDLADTVRRNVIAAIGDHTQLRVDAVDIDVDDLDVPPR